MKTSPTPHAVMERELRSTAKLNSRVRRLIDQRLDHIQKVMSSPQLNESRLPKLSEELQQILDVCSSQITSSSKLLIATTKKPAPTDSAPSGEEIVAELVSGRQRKN